MTIERRLARAGFTLTRDYPVPLERVWDSPGSRTSSTASSSTSSGPTGRAARKAPGACSRLWATTSREPPPAIGRWLSNRFGRFTEFWVRISTPA